MTTIVENTPLTQPSPWASRIAVTVVHFFVLVLFLNNFNVDTWSALLGLIVIHVYSLNVLRLWNNMERTTAGDTVIITVTLEYLLIAWLFWDGFSAWPWSTFLGLAVIQGSAFAAVTYWRGLSKAPPTAWFGLVVILLYVLIAVAAPVIAPPSTMMLAPTGTSIFNA